MSILVQHQDQVRRAASHETHGALDIERAQSLINDLSRAHRGATETAYPFQQAEVATTIQRRAHNARRTKGGQANAAWQEWRLVLTAKYLGLKGDTGSAIAHGVYIPSLGPHHKTKTNPDISAELAWLAELCNHTSPHHHPHLASMWQALTQQGYEPNARQPALRRSEAEVTAALQARVKHSQRPSYTHDKATALAAIAALQSTGHLVTNPRDSYSSDLRHARTRGWPIGTLSQTLLTADWDYHTRTTRNTNPPPTTRDRSTWDPNLAGMIENPTDSSLYRCAGPGYDNTMQNWGLHNLTRGAHFAHCSGGTSWVKEAYTPSNWGATCRTCNGDSAAHNCGCSKNHKVSGGGKHATNNAVPRSFPDSWSHMIPSSLYFALMTGAGRLTSPSLHGRCAVHIGSGTGSMRRALQLTGLFVIGVDIEDEVDAGTRVEQTALADD